MVGRSLGSYDILELLGAGGMGEVYRARDTELDRDVAIKVLSEDLAADPQRLARFEREAKSLAALNHPNIAAIYGIDRDGAVRFLVLEVVDGESLANRLSRGPLPVDEALAIGEQIAAALSAAHSAEIIHRDLKPANILIGRNGRVKIVDFGVAKALEAPGVAETARATDLTSAGMLIGTAPYMSPEQVRGAPADQRADVWAFGCVVYEMLAGRSAFGRETVADTLAAILGVDPDWHSLPPIPDPLRSLLGRCLSKDPERRLHDIADSRIEIEELRSGGPAGGPASGTARAPSGRARTPPRRRALWLVGATAVVAVAAVAVAAGGRAWQQSTGRSPALDPGLLVIAPFENQTGDPRLDALGRLATDTAIQGIGEIGSVQVAPLPAPAVSGQDTGPTGDQGVPSAAATLEDVAARARQAGAGTAILGHYALQNDEVRFRADLIDVAEGRILYGIAPVTASRDADSELLDKLRQRILGLAASHFGIESANPISVYLRRMLGPPGIWSKIPDYDAYVEVVRGLEMFAQDRQRSLAHFTRATELDPEFIIAWLWLETMTRGSAAVQTGADSPGRYEAIVQHLLDRRDQLSPYERYRLEFGRARRGGSPSEARRWAERVLEVHPADDVFRWGSASRDLALNEPGRTIDAFAGWEPVEWLEFGIPPGWWYFGTLTSARHLLGQYDEELRQARRALGFYPDVLEVRALEVRALAALGRADEINRVIDDSLIVRPRAGTPDEVMLTAAEELSAHGDAAAGRAVAERAVQWLRNRPPAEARPADLARALLLAERWGEARAVYRSLAGGPDPVAIVGADIDLDVLGPLGVIAAHTGDMEEARAVALRLTELDRPGLFGRAAYWRAAIAAALGDNDGAVAAMREWIAGGGINYVLLHRDPNFRSLWGKPSFQEILRPRG